MSDTNDNTDAIVNAKNCGNPTAQDPIYHSDDPVTIATACTMLGGTVVQY